MEAAQQYADADEQRLAEMGYKQRLDRAWSGFSNFAISFTIISVLAGCFTLYASGVEQRRPDRDLLGLACSSRSSILLIGFCMSELVSAYPTAGGIYWWAGKIGGPVWAWFTGWFNLIGLVAVVASVDYACAFFLNARSPSTTSTSSGSISALLHALEVFILFVLILSLHTTVNIFRTHYLLAGQQHLRLVARHRRRGDRRHPDLRPR